MEATTLTRAAGPGPLSAAADMPGGKPIDTPATPRAVVTWATWTRPRPAVQLLLDVGYERLVLAA